MDSVVSGSVVVVAILAISTYNIIDENTGNTIGKHPLVTTAMKTFCQLKPLIPRYHGTYNIDMVLRFSKKTAFLLEFSTMSRYYWLTSKFAPDSTISAPFFQVAIFANIPPFSGNFGPILHLFSGNFGPILHLFSGHFLSPSRTNSVHWSPSVNSGLYYSVQYSTVLL